MFFRSIISMLLSHKSIEFIHRKACFLATKRMLLSAENRKNRLVLSIYFTFTYYLLPITYYLMAVSVSRLRRDDDKNFRWILTVEALELRVVNTFSENNLGFLHVICVGFFTCNFP